MSTAEDSDQGFVRLVQYRLPPLESGEYTLRATQDITVRGQGEIFRAVQPFFVKGMRYQLDDGGVDSVFPPSGSQGEFGNVLPHVVLTDATLPWQRSPEVKSAPELDAAARRAAAADGRPVPTWLALLLFDEEDPPPKPRAATIADLVSWADLDSGESVFCPPRTVEYGEQATDAVTVIDVPLGQYAQLTPSLADLGWLAHTRLAEASAKATVGDTPPSAEFAVVFGNRLPTPGRTSTVFLVSLEGFGLYLPSDEGVLPARVPPHVTAVRLVVLRSWTFSAVQLRQSFGGTLEALDMSPATVRLPEKLLGSDAQGPAVFRAFGMGYTAMNHGLRNGGSTVSWYRGPLLPLGAPAPPPVRAQAADQLLRYDPDSGLFDVSYAAAWELGRLLALHDRAFATALYRWKLAVTQQAAAGLEDEIIDALLPPLPGSRFAGDSTGTGMAALPPNHRRLARVIRDVVGPAAARIADHQRTAGRGDE